MKHLRSALFVVVLLLVASAPAQEAALESPPGAESRVYKTVDGARLRLHLYRPDRERDEPRPAIIFFFGGGWIGGRVTQFVPQGKHFAERGMVAVVADYRVRSRHGVGAFECVSDAKSAIRWLRRHAAELGIDDDRIVAAGGSAGGHLAACTAMIDGLDEPDEDLAVSSVPNALILFNPVLDLSSLTASRGEAEAAARFGDWVTRAEEISPMQHVRSGAPPTIIFHGTADATVPFVQATRFAEAMTVRGNRCELVPFGGRGHGFFNRGRGDDSDFSETLRKADEFLVSLGYLDAQPSVDERDPPVPPAPPGR